MTMHHSSHPFTLLELMVAAAVLVIMMSFIFQFTTSAQKLWKSNTGRTEVSAAMDVVFTLINEDLENMYVVADYEDLDAQAGWYCMHKKSDSEKSPFANVKGTHLEDFCFFTQKRIADDNDSTTSMIHPVRYHFEPATDPDNSEIGAGKLYRFEAEGMTWDKIAEEFSDADRGKDPDWYFKLEKYTASDDIPTGYSAGDYKWPLYDEENLVAENLQSVQIFSTAAVDYLSGEALTTDDMPLMELPQAISVTIIASIPKSLRNNEAKVLDSDGDAEKTTDRAMTRVYLLK